MRVSPPRSAPNSWSSSMRSPEMQWARYSSRTCARVSPNCAAIAAYRDATSDPSAQFPLSSLLLRESLLPLLQRPSARAELKENVSEAQSLLPREASGGPQSPQRCLYTRRRLRGDDLCKCSAGLNEFLFRNNIANESRFA